jgi:nitrogenase molybdenum-iron protein NifN
MPGMVSPADIRYLREVLNDFHADSVILPDYSATLDGPIWTEYSRIPKGGTPLADIRRTASARATIEFGATWNRDTTAGALLETRFEVPRHELPWPVGVSRTDAFFQLLEKLTGTPTPEVHRAERGRLVDSIVDSHKYVFGKRVAVFGEEDLVVALATFLAEVGLTPVICASGGKSGKLKARLDAMIPEQREKIDVREDVDFLNIEDLVRERKPDLLVGNSKGYSLSRKLEIPLVRVGFPIHDRIGGARVLHFGYRGAQQLFDRVANTLIQTKQDRSPVGYTYM